MEPDDPNYSPFDSTYIRGEISESAGKGCLTTSLVLFIIICICTLAVWQDFFDDNLPIIVIGFACLAALPFTAMVGLWQSYRGIREKKSDEVNAAVGGNVFFLIVAIVLLGVIYTFFKNFRWPG